MCDFSDTPRGIHTYCLWLGSWSEAPQRWTYAPALRFQSRNKTILDDAKPRTWELIVMSPAGVIVRVTGGSPLRVCTGW